MEDGDQPLNLVGGDGAGKRARREGLDEDLRAGGGGGRARHQRREVVLHGVGGDGSGGGVQLIDQRVVDPLRHIGGEAALPRVGGEAGRGARRRAEEIVDGVVV